MREEEIIRRLRKQDAEGLKAFTLHYSPFILYMIAPWHYGFEEMFKIPNTLDLRGCVFLILAIMGCGIIQSIGNH